MDLHESSFYIYLGINQWEKIVAVEIREQSVNIARPTAIPLEASSLNKIQHSSLAPGDYPALAQYLMKISYSASALHTAGLDLEIVSF